MENERLAYENKGQEEPEGENNGIRYPLPLTPKNIFVKDRV